MLTSLLTSLLSLSALLTAPALAGDCLAPSTPGQLKAALDDAEARYADLDLDGFLAATELIEPLVDCSSAPIGAALAARTHRLRGLRAFVDQDEERAKLAFAAARAAEPGYSFPESLLPTGNPALDLYGAVPLSIGASESAAAPTEGMLTFDGVRADKRPTAWPTVAQHVVDDTTRASAYLWPGEALFDYPAPEVQPDPVQSAGRAAPEWGRAQTGLTAGAGVSALAGGAFYLLAARSSSAYNSEETDPDELDGLRGATNRRSTVAGVAGAVAVGLGGAAVLTWQF